MINIQFQGIFKSFLSMLAVVLILDTILQFSNKTAFIRLGSFILIPTVLIILLTLLSFTSKITKLKLNLMLFIVCIVINIAQVSMNMTESDLYLYPVLFLLFGLSLSYL